jgi:hypothetical protein
MDECGGDPKNPERPTPSSGERERLLALLDRADAMVSALCNGDRRWTMSIPAEPERDSDLVIGAALHAARAYAATPTPSPDAREPDRVERMFTDLAIDHAKGLERKLEVLESALREIAKRAKVGPPSTPGDPGATWYNPLVRCARVAEDALALAAALNGGTEDAR